MSKPQTTTEAIPFGRPMIDQAEIDAVTRVLSGTTLVHGPVTHEFEVKFAERAGVRHAISVASCTAGLHLSLFVKGVGGGDKVIVPAMTHVATAHSVEYCGATPLFADVEASTGNIDPQAVTSALGPQVRAVMVVHYLGLPCEMDVISPAAERAGAFVVEDCAISIDATYGTKKVGGFGLGGCFSFYPIKHMTTVEGGMVTTNDDAFAAAVMQKKAFGYDRALGARVKPGIYDVNALGFNYRMNEVEAAVGLVQLGKLDAFQRARADNDRRLRAALSDVAEITLFPTRKGKATSSHYCLNVVLPRDGSIARDAVVAKLKGLGVGSSVHYPEAVPLMTYYREKYGFRRGQFPVAEWLAAQTISLPVGPHLGPQDPERIGAAVKQAIHDVRTGR